MIHNDTQITSKTIVNFVCEICDFKCCKKGDLNRHLNTLKHKMIQNDNNNTSKHIEPIPTYTCECGKILISYLKMDFTGLTGQNLMMTCYMIYLNIIF
jgi:hypothetical protein